MPIRITHHTVVVHRDGKNITLPVGKSFDFTTAEIADIHASNSAALRRPIVEVVTPVPEVTSEVDDAANAAKVPGVATRRVAAAAAVRKAGAQMPVADEDDL